MNTNDSKVIEMIEYSNDKTLKTIIENIQETGQLNDLTDREIIEEIILLKEQLGIDTEYYPEWICRKNRCHKHNSRNRNFLSNNLVCKTRDASIKD